MPRLPLAPSRAFALAWAMTLALAACGDEQVQAPGAVSPGEAEALEDAADMLDERRLPPEALPTDSPPEVASPETTPNAPPAEVTGDAAPAGQ